jgi:polyphosphate kinase
MKRPRLTDPRYYLNRHLQWLEFNRRVLEEARDVGNPLLERVKFLAITANNLDEFVEVRVASFLQRIEHGSREIGPDGLTAGEELAEVSAAMHALVEDQYKCWNGELVPALAKQAIREVTVVVELKASFDEASNIRWARSFEEAGVQVFHGLAGLKTHAKLALVVRHDPCGKIRRYVHLGTGNYNPSTARFYSDLSLLTGDESITSAVHDVFNYLTAYSEHAHYKPLLVAPRDMAKSCLALIDREARQARRGCPARIIVKVNAIVDPPMIRALYRASQSGVGIDLIVRGPCALVPGVRGLSSRIRVRSIVGRFLEHSRIFYFENGGKPEIYLGSADWMQRNLYERVEVLFPLKDPQLCQRVCGEILSAYLADTRKAHLLGPDGRYSRRRSVGNGHGFSAQEHLMRLAGGRSDAPRTSALATPLVVYTADGVKADPVSPSDQSDTQDSVNAAV